MNKRLITILLSLCLLLGCTSTEIIPAEKKVTLLLKWLPQAQFAGNYVALDKGFYSDEGLDVTIIPYDFNTNSAKEVAERRVDFAIIGADTLIIEREKGHSLKAVAVIYQKSPVAAYTLTESGILTPYDFVNKTLGLENADNIISAYETMMNALSINRSTIKEIPIGYNASELILGITDISTGYSINEPQGAIEAGYDIHTILMADFGVDIYADVLVTHEELIHENPELVQSVVSATLQGWKYAISNQEEATSIVLRYSPTSTRIHETHMLQSSIPLIVPQGMPIGSMNKQKWENTQNTLFDQGLLTKKEPIDNIYTDTFIQGMHNT